MKENQRVASSYEDLIKAHYDYCDKTFQPFFVRRQSNTIKWYNKKFDKTIPVNYKYQRITYACVHSGDYSSIATSRKTSTLKSLCPAEITYVLNLTIMQFTAHNVKDTHNHDLNTKLYQLYSKNRAVRQSNDLDKEIVLTHIELGANVLRIKDDLVEKTKKFETTKALYNLRHKITSQEKNSAFELIALLKKDLEKDPEMAIEVDEDDKQQLELCFVQTSLMKKAFSNYCDHLCIDATYNLNINKMPVIIFVVVDGENMSKIVAFCLVKNETKQMTKRVFEYFIKHNPKSHYTKSIMVDKNLTEISAIEQLLPNVVIEICLFHVLKAVKIKISTMNMPFRANVSAKNYMQKLAYSQTYEQFLDNYNRMINDVDLKDTDFITYFNNNWLNIREMWCAEFRNQHFNLGDLTNNRIESLNQKLKVLIKKTSSLHHFYVDMKRFIDSQYSKAYLFQFNQMAKNKFYNTYDNEDINTALYEYRKFCTIYSSQLIEDEIYKAFFKPIVLFKPYDKTCFIQFKKEKEYHVHLTECNCPFYINFNLPCRHILRFIHSKKQSLFDPNLINKRWLLKTWFEIDFSSTFSSQNVESSSEKDEMEFLCTKLSNLLSKSSFDQIKKTKDNLIQFISKVENNIPFEIKELRNNSSKQIQTENFDDEIIEFPKETTIDSNLTSTLTHLSDIQLTITPPTDVRTPGRSKLLSSSQTVVGKKRVLDKPSVRLEKHRRSLSTRSNINQILSVHNQMDEIDDANRRRDLQNALAEAEGIWMEFSNNLNLSYNDKYLIETPGETLTQGIISHCQNILKKQFPHVFGLVDLSHFGWSHNPKVVPFYPFDVPKDDLKLFVQILNLGGHFICVSGLFNEPIYNDTDNCHCVFDVYDSLNINNREYKISLQRKNQWIVSLLSGIFKGSRNINFQLRNVEVTRQQNATDCGFHSLANAFWSCNAIQPGEMVLDMQKLRNHLIQIIQNQKFTEFPSKSSGHRSISLYDETDLDLLLNDNVYNIVICHCRTEFGGRNVVQCRQCKEYFHIDCIEQVPDDFENWLCDYRCNKGTIELD